MEAPEANEAHEPCADLIAAGAEEEEIEASGKSFGRWDGGCDGYIIILPTPGIPDITKSAPVKE